MPRQLRAGCLSRRNRIRAIEQRPPGQLRGHHESNCKFASFPVNLAITPGSNDAFFTVVVNRENFSRLGKVVNRFCNATSLAFTNSGMLTKLRIDPFQSWNPSDGRRANTKRPAQKSSCCGRISLRDSCTAPFKALRLSVEIGNRARDSRPKNHRSSGLDL